MDKSALVADITPLPKGFSGTIKVVRSQSRIFARITILSYDLDENEVVFGTKLKARYHATDTWMLRNGYWQIVAGQIFRYYADPSPGKLNVARLNDYPGTYQLAPGLVLVVLRDHARLYAKSGSHSRQPLLCEDGDVFFIPGVEGRRIFRRDGNCKVDALIDRRNNEDLVWKKVIARQPIP